MKYIVPEGTKEIKNSEFFDRDDIDEVVLPEGLEAIGDKAFACCSKLKTINIPPTVKYIGREAFSYCYSLKSISIPASVEIINDNAFACCTRLRRCVLPTSVKLGEDIFRSDYDYLYDTIVPEFKMELSENKDSVILTVGIKGRLGLARAFSQKGLDRLLKENAKYCTNQNKVDFKNATNLMEENNKKSQIDKKKDKILEYDFGKF